MFNIKDKQKGFTLIELLVALAIIGLLSSIILASLNNARVKARDARRKSDLDQIAIAMQLYYDDNDYYPKQSDGSNGKIGEGSGLDTMLAPYFYSIPLDPLGPGDGSYYYYYDGKQSCSGKTVSVIFVRNLEQGSGNGSDYCASWGGEGGAGGANTWHIVLGPSDG